MIVTGKCIIMEQGEYSDVKFVDDRAVFPLDRIDRLLPLAKRVIYDSVAEDAVNIILNSSAIKRLCYPAMKERLGDVYIDVCTDYRGRNLYEYFGHFSDVLENEYDTPRAKFLTTFINRYIVTYKTAIFSAGLWQEKSCNIELIREASLTPVKSRTKLTQVDMQAADSLISAIDMAKLYDELYLDGWVIIGFGNRQLTIEAKDEIDDKEVSERKERAIALIDKAIGEHSKYNRSM